jgi:hypothetical protein
MDYGVNLVTITGTNFSPDGAAPAVAIDSVSLALVSYTNESAAVTLPANWVSGACVLAVTNSSHQTGVYHMTLSAPLGNCNIMHERSTPPGHCLAPVRRRHLTRVG